jgi:hypothetical protein
MFCPKCATQNIEGASFCRVCGANISLVPQALTGELPQATERNLERHTRHISRRPPSVEHGIARIMSGLGFLAVSLCVATFAPAGRIWWFWLLIPAFNLLGKGISEIMRAKQNAAASRLPPQIGATSPIDRFPAPPTGELRPSVPSVTEGTTRHLGAEAATRHFDSLENQKRP